ncbi:MAG: hypothetical protein Kapaf2KO_00410 [Candidatus Kapaibacteriales bacterium]
MAEEIKEITQPNHISGYLGSLYEAMPDRIIVLDFTDKEIVFDTLNTGEKSGAFEVISKCTTYQDFFDVVDRIDRRKLIRGVFRLLRKQEGQATTEVKVANEKGIVYYIRVRYRIFYNQNSSNIHILWVLSDITKEIRSTERLSTTVKMLDELEKTTRIGGWRYDYSTGMVRLTTGMLFLFPALEVTEIDFESLNIFGMKNFEYLKAFLFEDQDKELTELEINLSESDDHGDPTGMLSTIYKTTIRKYFDQSGKPTIAIGSFLDVTESSSQKKQLESYRVNLEELVDRKSRDLITMYKERNELYRTARHDINNPLTSIFIQAELLKDFAERDYQSKYKEKAQTILNSANSIKNILAKFMDERKNLWEDYQTNPVKVDISLLLEERISGFRASANKKGIIFNSFDLEQIEIRTDRFLFIRVFENLLSNAIKYCSSGDIISVRHLQYGDFYRLTVQDTGPGIRLSEQEKLFSDYTAYTNKPTGGEESTGMGLYFTQKYAALLGGHIECDSKVGKGSSFHLMLPFNLKSGTKK